MSTGCPPWDRHWGHKEEQNRTTPSFIITLGDANKETDACNAVGQPLHLEVLWTFSIAHGRAFDPHQMREGYISLRHYQAEM